MQHEANSFGIRARRALDAAVRALGVELGRCAGGLGVASSVVLMSGCYSLVQKPLSEVTPDAVVEASISDIGRTALADRTGADVTRLNGKVVGRSDSSVSLMVSQVSYLERASSRWQGQELTLRSQDISRVSERTFSRGRTILFAVAIGALAAVALTQTSLVEVFRGGGTDPKTPEPPPES